MIAETASNISDEVGLVRPAGAPAPRAGAPVSFPTTNEPLTPPPPTVLPPVGPDIHADIEKILSEIKLPERRDFKGGADATKSVAQAVGIPTNPADAPASALVTKPPTEAETTKPVTSSIAAMHTLKDDLQHAVRDKKMSLVRAVSLEQDKKARIVGDEDFGRTERRKRILGLVFSSVLFLFLGLAALFGVYVVVQSQGGTSTTSLNSLVFAEQSISLPLTNTPLITKQQIAAFRSSPGGTLGSITRIVPVISTVDDSGKENFYPATLTQFLSGLGARPPEALLRALGDEFFFGVHVVDKNAPVIVATVLSYDNAFASMLEWESSMNADLAPAFTQVPITYLDSNGIPAARLFKDDIMRNYDVRELKDDAGQVELYYSFPNPKLLIIAESPYSFPEILNRLQSGNKL